MEIQSVIKGIFLLILGVSGNFVAETLGCKTQKLLSENMLAKHAIIYFIIYFALGFTSDSSPHPVELGKSALLIWVFFVMFTRMSLQFTIAVFVLLAMEYITLLYVDYYESQGPEKFKDEIEQLKQVRYYLFALTIAIVIIGFLLYFKKQHSEYYKNWSTMKFIFGVNKCSSMR